MPQRIINFFFSLNEIISDRTIQANAILCGISWTVAVPPIQAIAGILAIILTILNIYDKFIKPKLKR